MQQEEEEYSCIEEFFVDSCRHGDYEDAIGCFEDNVDVLWFDFHQNNCIHMASANGHIQILNQIIEYAKKKNVDMKKLINHQNEYGCTPLHWAVMNNQLEVIKILLENEADQEIKNSNNLTCLEEALHYEKHDVFELLSKNVSLSEAQQQEFDMDADIVEEEEQDEQIE